MASARDREPDTQTTQKSDTLFIKENFTSTGAFEKLKARLVAGGHMQDKSIYDDVSSPTVSTAATFLIAAIAAQEHRHVATLDIWGRT